MISRSNKNKIKKRNMVLMTEPDLLAPVLPIIPTEDLLRKPVQQCLPCSTLPCLFNVTLCKRLCKTETNNLSDDNHGKYESNTTESQCCLFNCALQSMSQALGPGQEALCSIKELPGKGLAMVALQKFYPGDIIMAELPLLVMPCDVFNGDDGEDWLDEASSKLSCQERQLLFSLTDARHPGEPTSLGRLYTNCMSWGDDISVCPVMARANHSCRPNAEFLPRFDMGVNELRASYMIEAGEEVTINYMTPAEEGSDVRRVRQEYLERFYCFQCTCQACNLQGTELEADEEVREEMKELQARGAQNWTQPEVLHFLDGASKTQGTLLFVMCTMEQCWAAALDQELKMDYCVKGLDLALTIYDQGSPKATEWEERMVDLQLWADCYLPQHG